MAFDSEMRTSYLWEKSDSKSLFQAIIISSEGDTVWRLVVNNYLVSWDTQGREKTFWCDREIHLTPQPPLKLCSVQKLDVKVTIDVFMRNNRDQCSWLRKWPTTCCSYMLLMLTSYSERLEQRRRLFWTYSCYFTHCVRIWTNLRAADEGETIMTVTMLIWLMWCVLRNKCCFGWKWEFG